VHIFPTYADTMRIVNDFIKYVGIHQPVNNKGGVRPRRSILREDYPVIKYKGRIKSRSLVFLLAFKVQEHNQKFCPFDHISTNDGTASQ
jgi:hypothetical protein